MTMVAVRRATGVSDACPVVEPSSYHICVALHVPFINTGWLQVHMLIATKD